MIHGKSHRIFDRIIHTDLSSFKKFLYVQMTSKSINSLKFHWTIKINLNFTFTQHFGGISDFSNTLCSDQLFIMRLDIRYKDIHIPYKYILIRLADRRLSINLFGIYLWYPYTWPISLAYKYILIRNKYILVPYILSDDK